MTSEFHFRELPPLNNELSDVDLINIFGDIISYFSESDSENFIQELEFSVPLTDEEYEVCLRLVMLLFENSLDFLQLLNQVSEANNFRLNIRSFYSSTLRLIGIQDFTSLNITVASLLTTLQKLKPSSPGNFIADLYLCFLLFFYFHLSFDRF